MHHFREFNRDFYYYDINMKEFEAYRTRKRDLIKNT